MHLDPSHGQAPHAPLTLPSELTIYTVGELHPQWSGWVSQATAVHADGPWQIDAAAVDQVDAAGLQLLLSLGQAAMAAGATLQLLSPSATLQSGCRTMGLGPWLDQHAASEEA